MSGRLLHTSLGSGIQEEGCSTIFLIAPATGRFGHVTKWKLSFLGHTSLALQSQILSLLSGFCWWEEWRAKSSWEGKGLFRLRSPGYSPSLREVRAGTRAGKETGGRNWSRGDGGMQLPGLLLMACWASLPRTTSSQVALPTVYWALNHENAPQACSQANLVRRTISQLRLPLPKWLPVISCWLKTSQHRWPEVSWWGGGHADLL